jgi:hypothetical protein
MKEPQMASDEQFFDQLQRFLGPDAAVPVFYVEGGAIDREKTLSLPCFADFKQGV